MKRGINKLKLYFFLFLIVYFTVGLLKGCLHNRQILAKYADLQNEQKKDLAINKELKARLKQVKTDSFVELTARKKLGLVKPGEVVYKIIEE